MRNLVFIFLLIFCACSKKTESRKLEITRAALGSNDLQGGVIVQMKNLSTGIVTVEELLAPPFEVFIEDGSWEFNLVGFIGPGSWSGATHCGSTSVTLGPSTEQIHLTVSTNCIPSPFPDLIATKVSDWDVALWDSSKWGP